VTRRMRTEICAKKTIENRSLKGIGQKSGSDNKQGQEGRRYWQWGETVAREMRRRRGAAESGGVEG